MRKPEPFFRKQTKTWYVQIGKKQHNLGSDKAKALEQYHALMLDRQDSGNRTQVIAILRRFLVWNKAHRSAGTHKLYGHYIESFAKSISESLTVEQLKPHHVTSWIDAEFSTSGSNAKRNAIRSIQRAFNWAIDEGHLAASPIERVKKPAPKSRDAIIEPVQWDQIIDALQERGGAGEFLEFLTVMRQTGCRPLETRLIEARHLDRKNRCLVFEREESKGHGREQEVERRVVPLTDKAYELLDRLASRWPEGVILRNEDERPWTCRAIGKRFERLSRRLIAKHGWREGVSAYLIRHTWATEALERGVDPVTVATIMGHKDLKQLMKTYQHLKLKSEYLRQSMQKATAA